MQMTTEQINPPKQCKCGCGTQMRQGEDKYILGHQKHKQNQQNIVMLREEHPEWTQLQIGQAVGVTKAYVGQVLKKKNLPCRGKKNNRHKCRNINCNKLISLARRFCTKECKHDTVFIQLTCKQCGKGKEMRKSLYNFRISKRGYSGTVFCNRECFGRWLGLSNNRQKHHEYLA